MQRVVYAANAKVKNKLESLDKRGASEASSLLQLLLRDAIKRRASSVHIEPQATSTTVRLRIDGRLVRSKTLSKHLHDPLVSEVKQRADLDKDSFLPQSGSFNVMITRQSIDVQATCLPTLVGERIVLHLYPSQPDVSLEQLGYWGLPLAELGRWLALPRGLILLVGDRSGQLQQTTTAIMKLLQQPSLRVAHVSGSRDSRQPSAKLHLALADNPDVVLINNLSGSDLVDTAIDAAARHLVIGVIPATNIETALLEIIGWASDQYSLSRFLIGIAFQNNEALLCPVCRQSHPLSTVQQTLISTRYPDMGELLGQYRSTYGLHPAPVACYSRLPKGCKACHQSGTNGQISLVQLNPTSTSLKQLIINDSVSLAAVKSELQKNALVRLDADRLTKALAGHIAWHSLAA